MNTPIKIAAASVLALAAAGPAAAQYYRETPQSVQAQRDYQYQRDQYEQQRDAYEASRQGYDARREDYQEASADYRAARAAYDRRLADWEYARARYDARWGYGAYARRYARPVWDESRWASRNPAPYAGGRYGYSASATPSTLNKTVRVRNYGSTARTYSITPGFRYADDAASGAVTLRLPAGGC